MSKTNYKPRKHINRVLEASKSRVSARAVLMALCHAAEFDRPESTMTRKQMEKHTRLCRNAVLAGLKVLKAEGSIVPIRNVEGGRGNAVTYRLCIAGQGGNEAPPQVVPAAGEAATIWDRIAPLLEQEDPDAYRVWLGKLTFQAVEGGELRIAAASRFDAKYCHQHFEQMVLSAANHLEPEITRVRIAAA